MADAMVGVQEACNLLQVSRAELQALVEHGELSATIGPTGEMSFRRDDVLNLKRARESEPTIIVPTGEMRGPPPGVPAAPLRLDLPDEFAVSSDADATAQPTALAPSSGPSWPPPPPPSGGYPSAQPPQVSYFPPPSPAMPPTGAWPQAFPGAPVVPVAPPQGGGPGMTPVFASAGEPSEHESGTEEIIIDDSDLVLMPLGEDEAAAQTSEVTVIGTDALAPPGGVPGVVQPAADQVIFGPETTAEATRVEVVEGLRPGADTEAISASYTRGGLHRVEAAIAAERTEELMRRSAPVYDLHPSSPLSTIWLIMTTMVLLFLGSVFGVIFWKGGHIENIHTPYVPRFLRPLYVWLKDRDYFIQPQPVQTPMPSVTAAPPGGYALPPASPPPEGP